MTEQSGRVTDLTGFLIDALRVRARKGCSPENPSHPSLAAELEHYDEHDDLGP
jgi:hypothetical protein